MKTILVSVASFLCGVAVTYAVLTYGFATLVQLDHQADIIGSVSLIEHLKLGNSEHVAEILMITVDCARKSLESQKTDLFWTDDDATANAIELAQH